ncbi:T9SS type A sorting domain-containing protein, partial [Bacteroidota bacterium]
AGGVVSAGSDLSFKDATFDLKGRQLVLSQVTLTLDETASVGNGVLTGDFSLDGTTRPLWGDLELEGIIANTGLIEDHPAGFNPGYLRVTGTMINRGTIRDSGSGRLFIRIDGAVVNESEWTNSETRFIGGLDQELSHSSGTALMGGWRAADSTLVTAVGPLVFDGASIDFGNGMLEMMDSTLTLTGRTVVTNTRVNTQNLSMAGGAVLGHGARFIGDVVLRGGVQAGGTVFEGAVTVVDTLRDDPGGFSTDAVEIRGPLRNLGVITNVVTLLVYAHGDLENQGIWNNARTYLTGEGRRSIRGVDIDSPLEINGEEVVLTGEMALSALIIGNGSYARLAGDGILHMPGGGLNGALTNFDNFGKLEMHNAATVGSSLWFYEASVNTPAEVGYDTLFVETYGYQVPDTYASALKNWWRFRPSSEVNETLASATFYYRDGHLGENVEAELQVYYSANGGTTWQQVSTSQNTTWNAEENSVTIANVPARGDYLLSSDPDPTSVVPSVIFSITGRSNIRMGAPSRYLVHYVNNSDQPTGDMLVAIGINGGGHIQRIEPSGPPEADIRPIEATDFVAEEIVGDTLALLWVSSLDARDERSFNLVATADPDGTGKTSGEQFVVNLVIGGVLMVSGGILLSYALDHTTAFCRAFKGQMLDAGDIEVRAAIDEAIRETQRQWDLPEKPAKVIVENFILSLVEKVASLRDNSLSLGKAGVECLSSLGSGAVGYVKNKFHGVIDPVFEDIEQARRCQARQQSGYIAAPKLGLSDSEYSDPPIICPVVHGTLVNLPKVASWDPNEKTGPNGVGELGFVTTAGRTNYTILFENKAEATAAAYKVVIHDTLSSNFDPESVVFGHASHDGFKMNRDGNVLVWEIEGIELPPNVTPPEGEGFVSFAVDPVAGLESGDELRNHATIVFDANPPIRTNDVVNTLDYEAPVTSMLDLAEQVAADRLAVRWNSSDRENGSGVDVVNLFASVDGSGYTYIGKSASDSLVVPLTIDGTYSFYALAVDRVGNIETTHPTPVSTQVTVVGLEDQSDIPSTFRLEQNYPNPFNPTTSIRFAIPETGPVQLHVYDTIGRRVAVVVDSDQMEAGWHTVSFNGSSVASGVYFVRLQQGDEVDIKPITLLR